MLPSPDQYTVAVRFCSILYELHEHNADTPPVIDLPYRMIFAVATKSSVYLYDTQQSMPIGLISNIHYTRLTDLAWSHDGRILIVSSTDGFCTLITFAADELGVEYVGNAEGKENGAPKKAAENSTVGTKAAAATSVKVPDGKANPIAIRRKPRVESAPITTTATVPTAAQVFVAKTPEKVIALEIPTGIISTKDKFDSPEITSTKPATPISFRRAPRTAETPGSTITSSPGHFNEVTTNTSSSIVTTAEVAKSAAKQPKSSKKAMPIAVRRHQRNILPDSVTPVVDRSATEDEAMDAWPIDQPRPATVAAGATTACDDAVKVVVEHEQAPATIVLPMEVEETEDMRLVYDDESQAEEEIADGIAEQHCTPNAKTPRRVELRTISTPKAKKKL